MKALEIKKKQELLVQPNFVDLRGIEDSKKQRVQSRSPSKVPEKCKAGDFESDSDDDGVDYIVEMAKQKEQRENAVRDKIQKEKLAKEA